MTLAGYFGLAIIAWTILLTWGFARRFRINNDKPVGKATSAYVGVVIFTMSMLFFPFIFYGVNSVANMVTLPKYEAVVISYQSEWVERTTEDSNGNRHTRDVLMHRPLLRFTDDTGEEIERYSTIQSGAEPVIGSTRLVAYGNGTLEVISAASIGMMIGLFVMLTILGYCLTQAVYYVFGWNRNRLNAVGMSGLFYVLIPGGILGMLAGLLYGVYSFFQPGSDVPVWVLIMCIFFSLALILAMWGMFFPYRHQADKQP